MGKALADRRRRPFFQVGKDHTRRIREQCDPRRVGTIRNVYFEIVEQANDNRDEAFEAVRSKIAERACVHVSTVTAAAKELVRIGLLEIEHRCVDGHNLPNIWTLTDPPETAPVVLVSDEDPSSSQARRVVASGEEGSSSQATPTQEPSFQESSLQEAAAAGARGRASRIAEVYRSEVAPHLSKVAEWQPAMIKGADLQVSTLMEGAPDAPWGMIAASAAAARQAGDLTTGSPVTALQFKLQDWTRGKLDGGPRRPDPTAAARDQLDRFRALEARDAQGAAADDVEVVDAEVVPDDEGGAR